MAIYIYILWSSTSGGSLSVLGLYICTETVKLVFWVSLMELSVGALGERREWWELASLREDMLEELAGTRGCKMNCMTWYGLLQGVFSWYFEMLA